MICEYSTKNMLGGFSTRLLTVSQTHECDFLENSVSEQWSFPILLRYSLPGDPKLHPQSKNRCHNFLPKL